MSENEKAARVLCHFNTVAAQYDFMNTLLSFGIHHLWKRTAMRMIRLSGTDSVLDICGGTGDLAVIAAQQTAGPVVLYDMSRPMIEAGKSRKDHSLIRNRILYVQGDAEHLSFPDQSFDAVSIGFGIRNVANMIQGFTEIFRVLKPCGKLMCLEFSQPTFAPFRWLYDLYSFYIMPWLGERIAGSRQAYTYLPESIRLFPKPDELVKILETIGFSSVTYKRLTNGIAVIHLGVKP